MTISKAVVLAQALDAADTRSVAHGGRATPPHEGGLRQLLPVANRPLLLHALDALEAAGVCAAAVVVDEGRAPAVRAVIEASPPASLLAEVRSCPAGSSLDAALASVRDLVGGESFMLHLGDSLQRGGLRPLLAGPDLGSVDARVLMCGDACPIRSRLSPTSRRPRVEALRRNGASLPGPDYAGVYVFGSGVIDVAATLSATGASVVEPAHLMQALGRHGGHVETLPTVGTWRLGRHLEGWLEGNRLALEGLVANAPDAPLFDTDVQGSVVIHPTAEIRSSVIRGPAVIGPMARLTDAYVGPYTSIGAGVLIEAAEVEHSIILPGASIRYLGGRLEASIIGSRARVFRDFRLPKALRLTVGEGAEVALA